MSTTSGRSRSASSTASAPSAALPTTSTPSIRPTSIVSPSRTTRWSSATTTRIGARRHAGTSSSTRQPPSVAPACMVPPARSIRSRMPSSPRPPPASAEPGVSCAGGTVARGFVLDAQRRSLGVVMQDDGGDRPGRVASHVGQRLLRSAVEREAGLGRERRARSRRPSALRPRSGRPCSSRRATAAARLPGSSSPRRAPTACRALARPSLTSSLARSIAARICGCACSRSASRRAAWSWIAAPDSECASTSCISLAIRPRSASAAARACVVARVLELGEQDFGALLAVSRLLHEVGDQSQQRTQQSRSEHAG